MRSPATVSTAAERDFEDNRLLDQKREELERLKVRLFAVPSPHLPSPVPYFHHAHFIFSSTQAEEEAKRFEEQARQRG